MGRTDNFKTTVVQGNNMSPGDMVDADIVDARGATLYGRPVRKAACAV